MSETPRSSDKTAALEADLRKALGGEVWFDRGSRVMYATDASQYRQVPIGVVVPRTSEEVEAAVACCRAHDAPVLMRGAATSLAGQGCNVAVIVDTSRHLNRIIEIDPTARLARVQPGVICDDLRNAAERHGLTFGPDPSTHASCTLGGMIGNNACGVHSLMAGKTVDNVEALDILTYDGTRLRVGPTEADALDRIIAEGGRRGDIYTGLRDLRDACADEVRRRFPDIPRRVSGYNLDQLLPENHFNVARALVGSEGTCAVVLEATVRLVPSPKARVVVLLGYPDVAAAGDHVPEVLAFGPIGLEGTADSLIENLTAKGLHPAGLKHWPEGRGWLMAEFGGDTRDDAREQAERLIAALAGRPSPPTMRLLDDPAQAAEVWAARESAVGASARLADGRDTWPGWEDAAVPPDRLGDYLRDFQRLLDTHGYRATLYGHFGQGCLHARIDFDMASAQGLRRYRHFVQAAADLVVSYGGSLTGEHGDGQARGELLERMFGPSLMKAFGRFKAVWDPDGRMNPGKLIDPLPLDTHLRQGADYRLPQWRTHFQFPQDQGSMARATARCVGVGKCRREQGGTMCPSYKVTCEERHTTRGRARLLAEMLDGQLPDGWRDESVKQALDLCLACKGCKRDCPAGVDIATYKAEFLSHYYEKRRRPRHAYAFGLIHRWARLGWRAAPAINALNRTPGLSRLVKALTGMSPQRAVPAFARQPFTRWFARRSQPRLDRPAVLLWPDTFTNYFQPEIARAAVQVLEAAGRRVVVPGAPVCCGRPLYDYGMLSAAKRLLRRTLDVLGPHLRDDVPVVVLEPSCAAVFRDELINLFPDDPAARKLSALTFTMAQYLRQHASGASLPRSTDSVLLHGHCHQKAIMGMEDDLALLRELGATVAAPDTGCCGMAGSFGFEKDHYEISRAIGEQSLLPAVRATDGRTLVITDGFSCREQVAQLTGRRPWHLAQVLAVWLNDRADANGSADTPSARG